MRSTIIAAIAGMFVVQHVWAQSFTLEQCRRAAVDNSTLGEQSGATAQKWEMKNRAAGSTLLPQLEINAQGSYQNQTPQLPDGTPLTGVFGLSRDQYRATLDLNQVIYGGGSVRNTRRVNEASARVESASIEVQQSQLLDRINALYLDALLAQLNAEVLELTIKTITADRAVVVNQQRLGTATGASVATLEARRLELEQQLTALRASRSTLVESLSILTGINIPTEAVLEMPTAQGQPSGDAQSQRAELELYDSQVGQLKSQARLLNSRSNPKLSLFASAGYGRPGYNFISNNFDFMGIAGLRLNVPLTAWDATVKERNALDIEQKIVLARKRDYQLSNKVHIAAAAAQMAKWQQVAQADDAIIKARELVRATAASQLAGGIALQSQYVTELNNELSARVNASINRLEITRAWIDYQAALGKY